MKIALFDNAGKEVKKIDLPSEMFEIAYNEGLINRMLTLQMANKRQATAKTKSRSEVKRSTRKLFRQKGTGRARVGDSGSPIRRGGGVAWGPRGQQNYKKALPKKQRRLALFSLLSKKASLGQVIAVEEYKGKEMKTKEFKKHLSTLPIERNSLYVIPEKNDVVQRSGSNLQETKVIQAPYLNIADLLKYRTLVLSESSINKMKETFLTSKK